MNTVTRNDRSYHHYYHGIVKMCWNKVSPDKKKTTKKPAEIISPSYLLKTSVIMSSVILMFSLMQEKKQNMLLLHLHLGDCCWLWLMLDRIYYEFCISLAFFSLSIYQSSLPLFCAKLPFDINLVLL